MRSKSGNFLVHTLSDSFEHGGSSGKNDVGVQVLSDINITLHDGVVGSLVDTNSLKTNHRRLEQSLRTTESLVSDSDNLTIGKFVVNLDLRRGSSLGHLSIEVKSDVGKLLLDVTDPM